jgi:3',5'-cyclic-AMP phosphodiesterase
MDSVHGVRVVLAHISDTHFDGGERNQARAAQVMAYLNSLSVPLDAIVHTGDITENGLPHEHEQAAKTLVSPHPLYTCPGNHDGRTHYQWPLNQAYDLGHWVLVLCDSVILGRDDGYLGDATLDWLASVLDTHTGRPVFLGLHHPPVLLHQPFIDGIRLSAAERLAAVLDEYPDVVAVLCGHGHTPAVSTFAGRPLLVAPGVASTLLLPWEEMLKHGLDLGQPPAFAFHILDQDGRITTHFRVVADLPASYQLATS